MFRFEIQWNKHNETQIALSLQGGANFLSGGCKENDYPHRKTITMQRGCKLFLQKSGKTIKSTLIFRSAWFILETENPENRLKQGLSGIPALVLLFRNACPETGI